MSIEQISSKFFHYDKNTRMYTAWASDLPPTFNFLSNIYEGSPDKGFYLEGQKTGELILFYLFSIDKSDEGDIAFWMFKPTAESARRIPTLKGVSIVIWND